jgi:hypothetical protein
MNSGLVYSMPESYYHSQAGLSSTGAKKILQSPAHYQDYISRPQATKDAYDLGSACHARVLGVGAQVEVYPEDVLAKNGSTNTNAAREFEDACRAEGKIPLKRVQFNVVNKMAEAVLQNDTARALVEGGRPEVSMFTTDPETGVALRGRLDYLRPGKTIADLKTTSGEASEAGFSKSVFNFGYHVQYALYEHIYELITGEQLPWLWVVVETDAPYLASVFALGEDEQRMGRDEARRAINLYAECLETNRWPGYQHSTRGPIGMVKAPQYAIYNYIDNHQGAVA